MFSRHLRSTVLSFSILLTLVIFPLLSPAPSRASHIEKYDPTKEYIVRSEAQTQKSNSSSVRNTTQEIVVETEPQTLPQTVSEQLATKSTVSSSYTSLPTILTTFQKVLKKGEYLITNLITSFSQSTSTLYHSATSSIHQVLSTTFHLSSNSLLTFTQHIKSGTQSFLSSINTHLHRFPTLPTYLLTPQNLIRAALTVSILPALGIAAFSSLTQSALSSVANLSMFTSLSMLDLTAHTILATIAFVGVVLGKKSLIASYTNGKQLILTTFGREIGNWKQDALVTAGVITLLATASMGPTVIAASQSAATSIGPTVIATTTAISTKIDSLANKFSSTATTTYYYLQTETPTALAETDVECNLLAQCRDAFDWTLTLGLNYALPGGTYDFETDQGVMAMKNSINDQIVGGKSIAKTVVKTPLSETQIQKISKEISEGHAFSKHILEEKNPKSIIQNVKTKGDFESLIKTTLEFPDEIRSRKDGAIAFWNNEKQVMVIYNPNGIDKSTAFKPSSGKSYFNRF